MYLLMGHIIPRVTILDPNFFQVRQRFVIFIYVRKWHWNSSQRRRGVCVCDWISCLGERVSETQGICLARARLVKEKGCCVRVWERPGCIFFLPAKCQGSREK